MLRSRSTGWYTLLATIAVVAGCESINDPIDTSTPSSTGTITMSATQGNNQTGRVGTQVVPPTVRLIDALGAGQANLTVTFTVTSGGGTLVGPTQTTNEGGTAHPVSWTLGPNPGVNTVTATVANAQGSPLIFTATATASASVVQAPK